MKQSEEDKKMLIEIYETIRCLFWMQIGRPSPHLAGWLVAYQRNGLSFAVDRQSAEALRRLTKNGYLSAKGSTAGRSFKLTVKGAFSGAKLCGTPEALVFDWLEYLAGMESNATLPGTDKKIIMCFELLDTAGAWLERAFKTDKAWERYTKELYKLDETLAPLLMLGWLCRYTDAYGRYWALRVTEEGRAALNDWPSYKLPSKLEDDQGAYERGFNAGIQRFERPCPAQFQNIVAKHIPASKWF